MRRGSRNIDGKTSEVRECTGWMEERGWLMEWRLTDFRKREGEIQ
jgi:hypothetical protein